MAGELSIHNDSRNLYAYLSKEALSSHYCTLAGYMLANWMVRHEGMSTSQAVSTFAAFRPPGIYKDSYIDQLFKYNHEDRQGLKSIAWSISGRYDLEPASIQSLQFLETTQLA